MVSAEFAVLVPALVAFVVMLAAVIAAASAQVTVAAAAREAGRLVSRGESAWFVQQVVARTTPGVDRAVVRITHAAGGVWVEVEGRPRNLPGPMSLVMPRVRSRLWVLQQ